MENREDILSVFRADAQGHLETLQGILWKLEEASEEEMATALRVLHTLKGDARMVGLETVGDICHHLEDLLKALQAGKLPLTSYLSTLIFDTLNLLEAAILGTQVEEENWEKLKGSILTLLGRKKITKDFKKRLTRIFTRERLDSIVKESGKESGKERGRKPVVEGKKGQLAEDEERKKEEKEARREKKEKKKDTGREKKEDFVRVRTAALDTLLNLSGEISINREKVVSLFYRLQRILAPFLDKEEELKGLLREFQEVSTEYFHLSQELQISALEMRMLPFRTILEEYPALVEKLAKELKKEVKLLIQGEDILLDKPILESLRPVFSHIIRNAVDHGIESPQERQAKGKPPWGTIAIRIQEEGQQVVLNIRDDGRGIDEEKIRQKVLERGILPEEKLASLSRKDLLGFIFTPGFSTKEKATLISGRGIGMDVVYSVISSLRGYIQVDSEPERYTSFEIRLPTTLSITRVVLVQSSGQIVAIPLSFVEEVISLSQVRVIEQEKGAMFPFRGEYVSLFHLGSLLGFGSSKGQSDSLCVVVLALQGKRMGVVVDRVLREQEVVVKRPLLFGKLPLVVGTTILRLGDPAVILNVYDLFQRWQLQKILSPTSLQKVKKVPEILVVDDSITVRTIQKSVLEKAGYRVDTAASGREAWEKTRRKVYQLVITDIQMDDMDGFELTRRLRQDEKYKRIPIIMVTSLASEEDRKKGLELGAQRYIVKSRYDQRELLETVRSLIGEAE